MIHVYRLEFPSVIVWNILVHRSSFIVVCLLPNTTWDYIPRVRGCFWTKDTLLTRESISGNDRADLQTENNTEDHAVREYHKFTDRDLGTRAVVSKCGFPDWATPRRAVCNHILSVRQAPTNKSELYTGSFVWIIPRTHPCDLFWSRCNCFRAL